MKFVIPPAALFLLIIGVAVVAGEGENPADSPVKDGPIVMESQLTSEAVSQCGQMKDFPWLELGRNCIIPGQKTAKFLPNVTVSFLLSPAARLSPPLKFNLLFFDSEQDSTPYLPYPHAPFSCQEMVTRAKAKVLNIDLFSHMDNSSGYDFRVSRSIDASYTRLWYVVLAESCEDLSTRNATCPDLFSSTVTWTLTDPPTSTTCEALNLQQSIANVITSVSDIISKASLQSLAFVYGLSTFAVVMLYLFSGLLTLFAFIYLFWSLRTKKNVFFVHNFFICSFTALNYLMMANGEGMWVLRHIKLNDLDFWTWDDVPLTADIVADETVYLIFWIRSVTWVVTTGLMLRQLCLIAGTSKGVLEFLTLAATAMIGVAFAATAHVKATRWLFAIVAGSWMLGIAGGLRHSAVPFVEKRGVNERKLFMQLSAILLLGWVVYAWVWILGDGSRLMGNNATTLAYAVVDLFTRLAWCSLILRGNPTATYPETKHAPQLVAGAEFAVGDDDDDP